MPRDTDTTPREAAQRLGVRLMYVYGLLWTGELPGRKRDGRWVIPSAAVEARLAAKRTRSGHARQRQFRKRLTLS